MALDTRWKNPPGSTNEQLFLWAQDLIRELRKGDYLDGIDTTPATGSVTNAMLANMAAWTIKMRNNAASGVPQDQTINDLTAETSIVGASDFIPLWDASASEMNKATPDNIVAGLTNVPGMRLLTSGAPSGVATVDLPLGAYTAFRGIIVKLYGWVPATDGVNLTCVFSTDNGANWIGSGYNYTAFGIIDTPGFATAVGSGSAAAILLTNSTANTQVGNGANEGVSASVELLGWQLTTLWPRIWFDGAYISNAATPSGIRLWGHGANETAQDCTGLRFAFSSGNIASGNYAVYGLA